MANPTIIDSLIISFGLDPTEILSGLKKAEQYLNAALSVMGNFAEGMAEGFSGAADGINNVSEAAQNAAPSLAQTEEKASAAGLALKDAGNEAKETGDKIKEAGKESEKAAKKMSKLEKTARNIGKSFGSKVKRFAFGVVAPAAGMLAVGTMVKGYFSDLGDLAQLQKKTKLSTEELAQKQKLLSQYTAKDIELYNKAKKTFEGFGGILQDIATTILRVVIPVIDLLSDGFKDLFNFINNRKVLVSSFIVAFATGLTLLLLPALKSVTAAAWKFAAAILANPTTWLVLAIMALAVLMGIIIEDVYRWVNGSSSLIGKLVGPFKDIKKWAVDAFEAANKKIQEFGNKIGRFFYKIGEFFYNLPSLIGDAFNSGYERVIGIFGQIGAFFKGVLNDVIDWFKKKIKDLISDVPDFLLPDSVIKWANQADEAIVGMGGNIKDFTLSDGQVAALSMNPVMGAAMRAANIDNSNSNNTTTITNNVHVEAKSTDAQGIAAEIPRKIVTTTNPGVR